MPAEETNIAQLFHRAAATYPERTAIIAGRRQVTYRQLRQQVLATAEKLQAAGLGHGDRVLVFVPMGIALYRTVLALFHIGATAVFLDEWVNRSRLESCCTLADCRGFIGVFKARMYAWFSPALRKIPIRMGTSLSVSRPGISIPVAPTGPDDTALITFTTGSTGTPKAAKRTHHFLHAQFNALVETLSPRPGEVDMTVLPIVLLFNLGVGATSVIVPYKPSKTDISDIPRIWKELDGHAVNRITASPYFVGLLAAHASKTGQGLPQVKKIFTGGAPVFPDEAEAYLHAFPGATIEVIYGSTEAEPISSVDGKTLVAAGAPKEGLLVGHSYRGADVRIIEITDGNIHCQDTRDFDRLVLADGEVGEIVVSGAHVLTAYFNNPEALRRNKIFVGERCWHRTGDSGYFGLDGCLYLTGRSDRLIDVRGKRLSPFICEYRMRVIPGIRCGTFIQVADSLVAVVEADRHTDKEAIIAALRQLDIPYDRVHWLSQIPRDPRHHSKIDYELLASSIIRQR